MCSLCDPHFGWKRACFGILKHGIVLPLIGSVTLIRPSSGPLLTRCLRDLKSTAPCGPKGFGASPGELGSHRPSPLARP